MCEACPVKDTEVRWQSLAPVKHHEKIKEIYPKVTRSGVVYPDHRFTSKVYAVEYVIVECENSEVHGYSIPMRLIKFLAEVGLLHLCVSGSAKIINQIGDGRYASGLTGVDLFSCPIPGHEVINAVHFMICDTGEDPAKPCFGIDTIHAAGLNKGVCDCSGIAAAL